MWLMDHPQVDTLCSWYTPDNFREEGGVDLHGCRHAGRTPFLFAPARQRTSQAASREHDDGILEAASMLDGLRRDGGVRGLMR